MAEMDVWKKHQSREMKRRGRRKPWEDEWQRWIASGNAERRTRTPREKCVNLVKCHNVLLCYRTDTPTKTLTFSLVEVHKLMVTPWTVCLQWGEQQSLYTMLCDM